MNEYFYRKLEGLGNINFPRIQYTNWNIENSWKYVKTFKRWHNHSNVIGMVSEIVELIGRNPTFRYCSSDGHSNVIIDA